MATLTTTREFPFIRSGIDADFTVTSDAFATSVDVAEAGKLQVRLTENMLPKGNYEVTVSGRFVIDNLLNIPVMRLSKDAGTTWETYAEVASTTTDGNAFSHTFVLMDYSGANLDYVMQMKKGLATDTLTVTGFDVVVKRVS